MRYSGQIQPYLPPTAPLALRVPEAVYDTDPVGVTSTGPGLSIPMGDDGDAQNYMSASRWQPSRWNAPMAGCGCNSELSGLDIQPKSFGMGALVGAAVIYFVFRKGRK